MATDFAVLLHRFLTSHLAGLRSCSPNTIASYRDTFKLLIAWFRDCRAIPPDKLTLERINADAITAFLDWLETERHNSISTRTQRLAAVSSFFRWLQSQDPTRMASCQDILAVPAKRQAQPSVNHLTIEQTRRLLAQPDRSTRRGRRDATLLATLYDTAARVQEFADLTVRDIRPQPPALAVLTGKGRKTRHVPLGDNTAALLNAYLTEHGLDKPGHDDYPLFTNQHRNKLSRGGIAWIIGKYQASAGDPALAGADLSPHVLRHSKAMHLYEAGVPLPYIRDILGHVDLTTTEIYARASTEAKRKALEATYTEIVTDELPEWNHDTALLTWLGLCAVIDPQNHCHQALPASAAHNPALFIRGCCFPGPVQYLPAQVGRVRRDSADPGLHPGQTSGSQPAVSGGGVRNCASPPPR
ncbi:Tyrosine recombinase XerD [Mycobacterium simulans]|uniref:Tyrosine recombinase XerD n=1 Tax=Mycobacterium simulans TaxID=627089 RepID=A0A7Z7IRX6_9MYCO|nr:site-specific integrase [Mycobacterium simulans]SOJ57622.1 Tyrosine recombinase XerD [Mycobacterium simulans]